MKVKTDVNGIVRDTTTGALLNTDLSGLEAYKKAKKKNAEMDSLKLEVNSIKSEMTEIKNLLIKLVEKT
jgi:LPS O-antigen subunit length determinant protein (WzzB/FepE family)